MRDLEPGATWADVFPDQPADAFAPRRDDAEWIKEVDADPERFWREHDEQKALMREMARVIPDDLRVSSAPGANWGVSFPHGARHALEVLRRLPDRAGTEAFLVALDLIPPEQSTELPDAVT